MRGHPIDVQVERTIAGRGLPLPLQWVWGSGKTAIHGVGHDRRSMRPLVFARVGRAPEQQVPFDRVMRVLSAGMASPLAGSITEPYFSGALPGYGPLLLVRFMQGRAWSPATGEVDRDRLEACSRWLDAFATWPVADLGLEPRDEEPTARSTTKALPARALERLDAALAALRPAVQARGAVLSHGDLTVNNVLWRGDSFCVVDWEDVGLSYPERDLLALRMSWLMRQRARRFPREEQWLAALCEPASDVVGDPLAARLTRSPGWRPVLAYFLLTYGVTWLHFCFDPYRSWAELLLDRLAPLVADGAR